MFHILYYGCTLRFMLRVCAQHNAKCFRALRNSKLIMQNKEAKLPLRLNLILFLVKLTLYLRLNTSLIWIKLNNHIFRNSALCIMHFAFTLLRSVKNFALRCVPQREAFCSANCSAPMAQNQLFRQGEDVIHYARNDKQQQRICHN